MTKLSTFFSQILVFVMLVGVAAGTGAIPTFALFEDPGILTARIGTLDADRPGFTVVSAGSDHSLGLTDAGAVYAWGKSAEAVPQVVLGLPEDDPVVSFESGFDGSIFLTKSGRVFTWGPSPFASSGELPRDMTAAIPGNVIGVSSGGKYFLAWTDSGYLYSWGDNGSGRLGRGVENVAEAAPSLVHAASPIHGRVSGASAGRYGGTAWSSTGHIVAWGECWGMASGFTPLGIPAGSITDASIGAETIVASFAGTVYYASLATNRRFVLQGTITPDVVEIDAGLADSKGEESFIARTYENVVWAWGNNSFGQLGLGDNAPSFPSPQQVSALLGNQVTSVAAGNSHTLVASGTVMSAGANAVGQLGDGTPGTNQNVHTPFQHPSFWADSY
jgi:Alpha-tubulin suppressor and related RCC1 domain-containing proteins